MPQGWRLGVIGRDLQPSKYLHISNYKNSPNRFWPMHHGRNVGGEQIINDLNYNDMKEYRVTCDLSKSKNKNQENLFGGFIVSLGNISKDIEVTDNYPLVHIDTDDREKMKAIKLFVEFWEKIQTEE